MGRHKPAPNTLAALAEGGGSLYMQCKSCRHYCPIDCYRIATRLSWGVPLDEVEKRHRCTQCGKKDAVIRRGSPVSFIR